MPGHGFVTSGQWKNALRLMLGRRTKIMSHDTDTIGPNTAEAAAAPLDVLLTDITVDSLRRLNQAAAQALRLVVAPASRLRFTARCGRQLAAMAPSPCH
jgi:hypothetical protein